MMAVSDEELISILRKSEQDAQNFQELELLEVRTKANDYYDRKPLGDEEDGQSKVVTSEFADTVESIMPSMMRVFASGDDVVEFTPIEQQDEAAAREASQYIPHVLMRENDGFRVFYWWFKDALMGRLGVAIVDTEEVERVTKEQIQAWTEEQMALAIELSKENGAEEVEFDVQPDPLPMGAPMLPMETSSLTNGQPTLAPEPQQTFSGTMRTTKRKKRVVVDNVAPEDLLISPGNVRDIDSAAYAGYRKQVTVSDLIKLGLEMDDIDALADNHTSSPEEDQRQGGMNYGPPRKDSERRLWLVVAYVKIEGDDGISEMERVVYAHAGGQAGAIVERMEWEDGECPIATLTPILMPHQLVGRGIFDQVEDLQDVNTAITRGMLDNVYLTNRPRPAINGRVDILSVLDVTPGRPIQVQGNENPANAIQWQQVPSIIAPALTALEHMDGVRENRTGVTRYNQGLDANSLNKTASGINNIMSAAQQRQELMARVMANTGVSRLMRLIYRAVKRCAEGPVSYYGGQDWATCNPSAWPDDMHLEVSVGTGTGNKVQEIQNLLMVGQGQEKLIQAQGGVDGPLVNKEHIANTFRRMVQAAGFKATQQFVASDKDIEAAVQQSGPAQPPQDPIVQAEQVKAQAMVQAKQAELAMKQQESAASHQLKMRELDIKEKELALKEQELLLEQQRLQAEREKTAVDSYHREVDRSTASQTRMEDMQRADMEKQSENEAPEATDQGLIALADGLRAQGEGIAQGLQALAQATLSETEITRGPDGRVAGARRRPPQTRMN
jgi:hypothetical protein